jgi:hypothetical protein
MDKVLRVGIILIIISMALWLYANEMGHPLPLADNLDEIVFGIGAALVVIFVLVYIFAMISGSSYKHAQKSQCMRCGKKIPKNEVYCQYHRREATNEIQIVKDDTDDHRYQL